MKRRFAHWQSAIAVFDYLLVAALATWVWRSGPSLADAGTFLGLLLIPFWSFFHRYFGLYDSHRMGWLRGVASSTVMASVTGGGLLAIALLVAGQGAWLPRLLQFTVGWVVLVILTRAVLYSALHIVRRHGADQRYACVIGGSWESASELARQLEARPEWGLEASLMGIGPPSRRSFYRASPEACATVSGPDELARVGSDLQKVFQDHVIDEILIAAHPRDSEAELEVIRLCRSFGVQCRVCLTGEDSDLPSVDHVLGHPAWRVRAAETSVLGSLLKRMMDVCLSTVLLLALSPVFLAIALLVRLSSPGPLLFKQRRTGLRGREFVMYKFRTMIVGADSMLHLVAHRNIAGGPVFKDVSDLRITTIGRLLRRTSMDELPQLLNVLLGDMSLVGPRPLPVHESAAIEGKFRRRFNVKPGITCRWQVAGRSEIGFTEWMQMDVDYVDNWTFLEDVKLLLLTIPAVLSGKGAY